MSIQVTAKLNRSVTRLRDVEAADLTFEIDRNLMIEDLVCACAKRIEEVTARAGKKTR